MRKKQNIPKIFIRFLLTYFIIVTIPIFVLGGFIYQFFFDYMKEDLEKNCYSSLQKVQASHDTFISEMETISNQIYLSKVFRRFDLELSPEKTLGLISELSIQRSINNSVADIAFHFSGDKYIYTASGSNTVDMFFEQIFANSSIYTKDMQETIFGSNKPMVIPMHPITQFGKQEEAFITYVYPIPMQCHVPYASVLYYVPDSYYKELFADEGQVQANSYIVKDEVLLVQNGNLDLSSNVLAKLFTMDYKVKYIRDNGRKYLAVHTFRSYSATDYYRVVDLNEIYLPLHRAQMVFLIINLLLVCVCGLLMFWFSRMNYHPFRELADAIKYASADFLSQQEKANLNTGSAARTTSELTELLTGIEYVYTQNQRLNLELAQSKRIKRSVLLINFIKGRFHSKDSMAPFCEEANFRIDRNYYNIMLVQFYTASLITPIDEETEAIFNRYGEHVDIYSTELLTSNTLAVVSFFDTGDSFADCLGFMQEELRELGFLGELGVSNSYSDISNAAKAFIEASTVLTYHSFHQGKEVVYFKDVNEETRQYDIYPYDFLEDYTKAVMQNNHVKIEKITSDIVLYIKGTNLPPFFTQCILKDMSEAVIRWSIKNQHDNEDFYKLYNTIDSVSSLKSFHEFCLRLLDIYKEIQAAREEVSVGEGTDLLHIIQYINDVCTSPNFSLYNVAEHFHMSPSQLSNEFKAELHILPSDYVTGCKMRMAKNLLKSTTKSVSTICAELGYNDASSFIRKFKQNVGTTPVAYRKEVEE